MSAAGPRGADGPSSATVLAGAGSPDDDVPVIAEPWMAQSYWYVPAEWNVASCVLPSPVWMMLFLKIGEPRDSTLCGIAPALVQVQVTARPRPPCPPPGWSTRCAHS